MEGVKYRKTRGFRCAARFLGVSPPRRPLRQPHGTDDERNGKVNPGAACAIWASGCLALFTSTKQSSSRPHLSQGTEEEASGVEALPFAHPPLRSEFIGSELRAPTR